MYATSFSWIQYIENCNSSRPYRVEHSTTASGIVIYSAHLGNGETDQYGEIPSCSVTCTPFFYLNSLEFTNPISKSIMPIRYSHKFIKCRVHTVSILNQLFHQLDLKTNAYENYAPQEIYFECILRGYVKEVIIPDFFS